MAGELALVADILSIISLLIGIFFLSLGMIGLLRLPDVYNRLHATTKVGTLGAFGVLTSIIIQEGITPMGVKAFTVALFILLTNPISGHMIARAAYRMGVKCCEVTCMDEYAGKRRK
ncbi:cation:proton antiporter [Methanosarcina sp. 2.H.T.1A.6]|uniref:monovalent cation/H(+) antiporter subunit G n=1 Tax=unclassified Methanosarcina TaxID=2644672 RepID=UPI000621FB34|nr:MULTISPECIES: monovalent cation/H(+) antiporter subunit G [unclassified Methanosarcina]KKG14488.1 cation:proton antiporter [Methanosarcina sp. 2.H.T.1A.3]KKG24260.1 cation:proton antiporter [Methanosarcina sp. 2.H.T.1A.8]KKG24927.1 cation:proton antiporter [Methanosarcina sp. 2.H.T.1A.6]KKG25351.1 cation:proton antiporter [Methanosarcina sp. 2.H.T.1A.15]